MIFQLLCLQASDPGVLCRGSTGAPDAGDGCSAVKLQLHRPLADLRVLVTAKEPHSSLRGLSTACSFSASIFDSQSDADLQNCSLAEDIASGPSAHEERWLRIHGACSEASISIEVRSLPTYQGLQVISQPCKAAANLLRQRQNAPDPNSSPAWGQHHQHLAFLALIRRCIEAALVLDAGA